MEVEGEVGCETGFHRDSLRNRLGSSSLSVIAAASPWMRPLFCAVTRQSQPRSVLSRTFLRAS